MTAFEWLLIVVLSALWGGAFFFSEVALLEVPPLTVVLGRVGFAALLLHVVVRLSGQKMPVGWRPWVAFAVMGMLNNFIPFSLIVWGQTHLTSGVASIFNATTPFFAVVFAHFLTRDEPMTGNRVAGVVLGLGGVGILVGPGVFTGMNDQLAAQVAIIGAAISYSLAGIYGRRFAGYPPLVTATGQVTTSALMMVPVALYVDRPWELMPLSASTWGAVLGIASLCTALAYLIYFRILKTAGATNLMIVTLLIPPSAIALGVVFLGEGLQRREAMGMAVIGFGLLVLDGRILARFRR
ncbi:MAG: DMT family transporter [Rhodospirillales bacterium]|nr:DMT family transporter [Rhodospirillales bacterium]